MKNEQAEKHWQELVNREISRYCEEVPIEDQTRFSIHKNAVQFVRANLSQVPEVRDLIRAINNLLASHTTHGVKAEDIKHIVSIEYLTELKQTLKKLEGKK